MQRLIFQSIKQFFSWWAKELFALLPEALKNKWQSPENSLLLELCSGEIRVVWLHSTQRSELGHFPVDEVGRAAWYDKLEEYPLVAKATRILLLSAEQCLHRHILLPKQAVGNLQQVMGFEMDRYTPFKAEDLFFDVVDTGVPQQTNQLEVLFVATPKNALTPMLEQCRFMSLLPNKVGYSAIQSPSENSSEIDLLPESMRPVVNNKERLVAAMLALLLMFEVSAVLFYPSWVVKQELADLQTRISAIKDEVASVGQMRRSIDNTESQITALLNKKTSHPYAIDIMNELSKRLPEGSWLTDLRLSSKQLKIQGYSANATDLIQLLDDSPLFSNTRFTSPLASNKAPQQAFKIGLNIVQLSR